MTEETTEATEETTEATAGQRRLGWRLDIIKAAAELGRAGQLKRGMDHKEAAALIAAQVVDSDPETYGQVGFDMQQFIDLITALLPLLLMIFGGL